MRPFHFAKSDHLKTYTWTFLLLLGAGCIVFSCTKPELVGADLLNEEASQIGFTDTLSLDCRIVPDSSVLTYTDAAGRLIIRSLVGHLDDPFFGKSEAAFYTQAFLVNASSAFLGTQVDSVVLTLRYDTTGLSGDISQPVMMGVYRLDEELDPEQDYRSDYAPMTAFEPVALASITPRPYDSIYIQSRGDSVLVPPMARIKLGPQFINDMIMQDSSTFESQDSFHMWLKGLHVNITEAPNTMLAFDLRNAWSRMTVYYHNGTDTSEIHFGFIDGLGSGIHHTRFVHDYAGSVAQTFIDNPEMTDSLLFVQGMSGLNIEISIPELENLDNILINKAELEFYTADLPDDDLTLYPRITQLINGVKNEAGDIEQSEDVSVVLRQFGLLSPFGGALTDIDTTSTAVQRYRMNVTTSMQAIQKGETENQFYILSYLKPNVSRRTILYGPGHPVYPARLRLTYTIVQ